LPNPSKLLDVGEGRESLAESFNDEGELEISNKPRKQKGKV
jgi:hypothetical protein